MAHISRLRSRSASYSESSRSISLHCLLDADQPVLLLHLVERHLRHAERVAARIGRDVDAARPGGARDEQIFACRLARRELELRVADGDGVAAPRELGHFAGREQAHLLGLQERNDFPVAERRGYLHPRSPPHRVSLIIAASLSAPARLRENTRLPTGGVAN